MHITTTYANKWNKTCRNVIVGMKSVGGVQVQSSGAPPKTVATALVLDLGSKG